jgi:hypothetical protein
MHQPKLLNKANRTKGVAHILKTMQMQHII